MQWLLRSPFLSTLKASRSSAGFSHEGPLLAACFLAIWWSTAGVLEARRVYIYLSDWLAAQKRRRSRTAALVTSLCRPRVLWRQKKRRLSRYPLAEDKTACGTQGDTLFFESRKGYSPQRRQGLRFAEQDVGKFLKHYACTCTDYHASCAFWEKYFTAVVWQLNHFQ